MGMPQVPDRDHIPSIEEVVIQILESIALEELAMAHVINAEGEKMQALVRHMNECDVSCDYISNAFKNTNSTINSLIMKEWVMLSKLNTALEIYTKFDEGAHSPCKECVECERRRKKECEEYSKSKYDNYDKQRYKDK